jgi:hypothetical protein
MRPISIPWPTDKPRAREEWDFRTPFLPEGEVEHCWEYEMARIGQSKAWQEMFRKFRAESGGSDYEAFRQESERRRSGEVEGIFVPNFYSTWPEFPRKPYLSIPAGERKKRIGHWFNRFGPDELIQIPLKAIFHRHMVELRRLQALEKGEIVPRTIHGDLPDFGVTTSAPGHPDTLQIVAFAVSSLLTETEFVEQARHWHRRWHRERGTEPSSRAGASAAIKRMRADLCALGLWRLIQTGLSRQRAILHTQNVSGKPLFSLDPSSWARAMKRAELLIRLFRLDGFDT